jgi:hypothetical protein
MPGVGSGEGSIGEAFLLGGKKGMDAGGTGGRASIEIDGQRVPLSPEGIGRAGGNTEEVGKKLVEAVRAALDRAIEG